MVVEAGDNNNIHKNNIATKKEEELPRKMYPEEDRTTSRGKLLQHRCQPLPPPRISHL